MGIAKEKKQKVIKQFQKNEKDSGSSEIQIALLTEQINELTEHCRAHRKDAHARYGLIKLVGKRKKHLSYLQSRDEERYLKILSELGLRK
ncbi:MAG TPA: 30S ribosomal protein S15 [Candidatus Omnitrophota bacterium]|nr:30S ribosomal protein S15 [Candidatus Omnitrophota bacterium]